MVYESLDQWPTVTSFFGVDLKSGSLIVAALGIVHPAAYCCTCFIPISYLLVSIWILVALYFAASMLLFYGLVQDNETICIAWTGFMALFVVLMGCMQALMLVAFLIRKQTQRAFLVFLGLMYYALTIYFILVVNSHRKTLSRNITTDGTTIANSRWLSDDTS